MPDSSISEVPCANNELEIDTFDKLDELLRTTEKQDLAAVRQVNFIICNVDDNRLDRDRLRTAQFLSALPQLQTLQLDQKRGWQLRGSKAMGQLLQQAITVTDASATSFRELKTIIWGNCTSPLDEMLPLWELPVEHIEVSVGEPVAQSCKPWPAPNSSLKRLNLHVSTIEHSTLEKLLHLSPCLEILRYNHWCDISSAPQGSLLTALRPVQSTLRELNLSVYLYSKYADEIVLVDWILPGSGQLGPLREFSRLRKLTAPIVTLLGWSPEKSRRPRLAEVVPTGLTHLGLTEDLLRQETAKWDENFVLEELAVFLSVWRSVTPDLQVVEVWLTGGRWDDEEAVAQLRKMCEEARIRTFRIHAGVNFSVPRILGCNMYKTQ